MIERFNIRVYSRVGVLEERVTKAGILTEMLGGGGGRDLSCNL